MVITGNTKFILKGLDFEHICACGSQPRTDILFSNPRKDAAYEIYRQDESPGESLLSKWLIFSKHSYTCAFENGEYKYNIQNRLN